MKCLHGGCLDSPEILQQLVIQMLREKGVPLKPETPKPLKKIIAPFSTPGNAQKKGVGAPTEGRIFGRKLKDLTKSLVQYDDEEQDMLVPKLVVSACTFIEEYIDTEGLYRMSGSQSRQKTIRREMEANHCFFNEIRPEPSVLDVANLLKQFLRELPISLIPQPLHSLLVNSLGKDCLFLAILLLPPDHLACLSFLCKHLAKVSEASNLNKMTVSNLAIVLTPNLLPTSEATANNLKKQREVKSSQLKIHTDIVEILINNCDSVGILTSEVQERYNGKISQPSSGFTSQSEDNLEDESAGSRRNRSKKKPRDRQRSGSLSRVLSMMGKNLQKVMGRPSQTPGGVKVDQLSSVHSTPLPQFGGTPEYPSPRAEREKEFVKRKAPGEHESSPGSKKRPFESTFTPKIRPRSFSVKRFKRKKSEGKLKSISKEGMAGRDSPMRAVVTSTVPASAFNINSPLVRVSRVETRSSLSRSPSLKQPLRLDYGCTGEGEADETVSMPEKELESLQSLDTLSLGSIKRLGHEGDQLSLGSISGQMETVFGTSVLGIRDLNTSSRLRHNSGAEARDPDVRKPRSPSQRRIGVIRKRSKERDYKLAAQTQVINSPCKPVPKSPVLKSSITPIDLQHRPSIKLGRGRPNSTSVGLGKSTVVYVEGSSPGELTRKVLRTDVRDRGEPVKAVHSPKRAEDGSKTKLSQGDSLVSLKNDLNNLIESFGSNENEDNLPNSSRDYIPTSVADNVFEDELPSLDEVDSYGRENAVLRLSSHMENISFKSNSPPNHELLSPFEKASDDTFIQSSPVTRSQLRRQSHSFEFPRPTSKEPSGCTNMIDLRRQSSAFEFRSNSLPSASSPSVPLYENFSRDASMRDSLRRKNSSVRDLIKRLEGDPVSKPLEAAVSAEYLTRTTGKSSVTSRKKSSNGCDIASRPKKLESKITEEEVPMEAGDTWVDASAFFKNVAEVEGPPQCGRSSIVKMRQEMKGRVQDAASKFGGAGQTPMKLGASARRQSARLGTISMTPAGTKLPNQSYNSKTPSYNRRSTLTGIRTSVKVNPASGNPPFLPSSVFKDKSPSYLNPTIASRSKERSKSPIFFEINEKEKKSPIINDSCIQTKFKERSKSPITIKPNINKSPNEMVKTISKERTNSSRGGRVDRKGSYNSRDIKPKNKVERSTSGNGKSKKASVKRNKSATDRRLKGKRNNSERRYLTIGYVGEVTRSPLKERQNLPTNIRRAHSDQTPNRYNVNFEDKVVTRAMYRAEEELQSMVTMADLARKHSLRSEMMSPRNGKFAPHGLETPHGKVKRAASDRASPRSVRPSKQGEKMRNFGSNYVNSPRSQRF